MAPSDPTPDHIREALRAGRCPPDEWFDRFLDPEMRLVSPQHWTPLAVVLRAARWLDELGVRTVVDIGSGAGKLCVAGALSSRATFVGIEQRPRLVAAARSLSQLFGVDSRVRFIEGVFGESGVPGADAYYLYNPFGENLFGPDDERIDEDVELGDERYARDVAATERLLQQADEGTYVLTYNGFGGEVPPGYETIAVDLELPNVLRLWRKMGASVFPGNGAGRRYLPPTPVY